MKQKTIASLIQWTLHQLMHWNKTITLFFAIGRSYGISFVGLMINCQLFGYHKRKCLRKNFHRMRDRERERERESLNNKKKGWQLRDRFGSSIYALVLSHSIISHTHKHDERSKFEWKTNEDIFCWLFSSFLMLNFG